MLNEHLLILVGQILAYSKIKKIKKNKSNVQRSNNILCRFRAGSEESKGQILALRVDFRRPEMQPHLLGPLFTNDHRAKQTTNPNKKVIIIERYKKLKIKKIDSKLDKY